SRYRARADAALAQSADASVAGGAVASRTQVPRAAPKKTDAKLASKAKAAGMAKPPAKPLAKGAAATAAPSGSPPAAGPAKKNSSAAAPAENADTKLGL
ncbi:MAG: hypothetical protein VB934_16510, partial [Polyangiaceae bacterium]